jgi:hypothetical protein
MGSEFLSGMTRTYPQASLNGLSVISKLVIDEVNYQFARRISYVASTGSNWRMKQDTYFSGVDQTAELTTVILKKPLFPLFGKGTGVSLLGVHDGGGSRLREPGS